MEVVGQTVVVAARGQAGLDHGPGHGVVGEQARPGVAVAFRQVGLHGLGVEVPVRPGRGLAHAGIRIREEGLALPGCEVLPLVGPAGAEYGVRVLGQPEAEGERYLPRGLQFLGDLAGGEPVVVPRSVHRGQQGFQDLVGQRPDPVVGPARAPGERAAHPTVGVVDEPAALGGVGVGIAGEGPSDRVLGVGEHRLDDGRGQVALLAEGRPRGARGRVEESDQDVRRRGRIGGDAAQLLLPEGVGERVRGGTRAGGGHRGIFAVITPVPRGSVRDRGRDRGRRRIGVSEHQRDVLLGRVGDRSHVTPEAERLLAPVAPVAPAGTAVPAGPAVLVTPSGACPVRRGGARTTTPCGCPGRRAP